jgi:hypothetical protein
MVLMRVDFPSPVWPAATRQLLDKIDETRVNPSKGRDREREREREQHTNADDIELETALQELLLDLLGNAIETDVTFWVDGRLSIIHESHWEVCIATKDVRGGLELTDKLPTGMCKTELMVRKSLGNDDNIQRDVRGRGTRRMEMQIIWVVGLVGEGVKWSRLRKGGMHAS